MFSIVKKKIKIFYKRFISLKGEPKHIAMGLAIGIFIGVTPTIPFHTAMIILTGFIFKSNITSAYLGSWLISNPLTIPIFYLSQYELGRIIMGMSPVKFSLTDYSFHAIMNLGWQILLPLQAGGLIMAPFFAVPAYFVAHKLIVSIRNKKENGQSATQENS
ncbi:MAG: DUF2062 domain-containing protein [Deltaproteobacteria bacterium]|nr:DUF2062 domain-containing protein [Deltaproteobacteria bacterium]